MSVPSLEPPVRVMALHSLTYCERLFYLEEVEEIRLADESVYAGRQLHQLLAAPDESGTETRELELESESLGLVGKVDALRMRDGELVPYEDKRGRARQSSDGPEAWPSDALQVSAYALLIEESTGRRVPEGRVRYHADNVTVRVPVTAELRTAVLAAIARARAVRGQTERPPVTDDERKCVRCSLAPVCLPEEERFARGGPETLARLFPALPDREILHVATPGAYVRRANDRIVVTSEGEELASIPVRSVGAVIVHGNAQVTTQALHLCVDHDVAVHWLTAGGMFVAGLAAGAGGVQRRLRQYGALTEPGTVLRLARRLSAARMDSQLRYLLRATRTDPASRASATAAIADIRSRGASVSTAESVAALRGFEGNAARRYFDTLPSLVRPEIRDYFAPKGRTRRPPEDPFNAALSFGYSLLYSRVLGAVVAVGLDPSIGFFHMPRSASYPLVLDLMELFRVQLVDMPLVASINRRQWADTDFAVTREKTWLSDSGRKLAIGLFEGRLNEVWKHPVLDYSLSYARTLELEVRLLEKEWSGAPGLFARARLR